MLAQDAITEAESFAGDKKIDKNKPDKAIDKYKKAWKYAQKAMK